MNRRVYGWTFSFDVVVFLRYDHVTRRRKMSWVARLALNVGHMDKNRGWDSVSEPGWDWKHWKALSYLCCIVELDSFVRFVELSKLLDSFICGNVSVFYSEALCVWFHCQFSTEKKHTDPELNVKKHTTECVLSMRRHCGRRTTSSLFTRTPFTVFTSVWPPPTCWFRLFLLRLQLFWTFFAHLCCCHFLRSHENEITGVWG